MSNKKKLSISTLCGGIILNLIISTYHFSPNFINYFYSYLQYTNENIFTRNEVELLLSLSNIIYLFSLPCGIILHLKLNCNINTITGISLLLRISSIYILMHCSTNNLLIIYLILKSSSCGLCILPFILEIWKYFPNNKGIVTGIFFLGKGINGFLYDYISIKIINPQNINIIPIDNIYSIDVNENYFNYIKISSIILCILSSLCQCLIYPYSIYVNYFDYKKNKFKQKLNKGLIKDFYILSLSSPSRNSINSTRNTYKDESFEDTDENDDKNQYKYKKKDIKIIENKEPFISLITSYPFLQLTFIYFLIMTFNSVELSSINKLGFYNDFGEKFISKINTIWKIINILWNFISGYILDKIKFKKFFIILLLFQIFFISICYFISNYKYGYILYNIISSIMNSSNNVVIPVSFCIVFEEENGLLLYGISSILINTFYIYRNYIKSLLVEKIYYFVLCFIFTIFYMIALITLCLFEERKHIYKVKDENEDQIMFDDIGQELNDLDICDEKEFKNCNKE